MNPRNHRQGLTLIEVLVVIAIISILVALLAPMLRKGDRVKHVGCQSHLRQVYITLMMYETVHTNSFPNLDEQPGNDGPAALILLSSYVQKSDIFLCPLVVKQRQKSGLVTQKRFEPVLDRSFFISNGNDYAYYDGLSHDSITNPTTTPITADRFAWTNRSVIDKKLLNHPDRAINIGFADGHVERARPNIFIGTNYTPPWSRIQDPILLP